MSRRWYREDGSVVPGSGPEGALALFAPEPCFMRPSRSFILEGTIQWCETYGALVVANGEAWTIAMEEVPDAVMDAFRKEMEAEASK